MPALSAVFAGRLSAIKAKPPEEQDERETSLTPPIRLSILGAIPGPDIRDRWRQLTEGTRLPQLVPSCKPFMQVSSSVAARLTCSLAALQTANRTAGGSLPYSNVMYIATVMAFVFETEAS